MNMIFFLRDKFFSFLFILFFLHGILYFVFPNLMFEDSWIKYIKYIIVYLALVVFIKVNSFKEIILLFYVIFSLFMFVYLSHYRCFLDFNDVVKRLLAYLTPLLVVLISSEMKKKIKEKYINVIIYISIIVCFLEYFLFRNLILAFNFIESEGYYRSVSIFFNPNNAGIMFSFMIIYCINKLNEQKTRIKLILVLLCLFACVIFTSSKTPLVIIPMYYFIVYSFSVFKPMLFTYNKFLIVILSLFVLFGFLLMVLLFDFYSLFEVIPFRKISVETGVIRFQQIIDFINKLQNNFLFPNYNLSLNETYDNAYIQLWSDFGFFGFIIYLGYLFYFIVKNGSVPIRKFAYYVVFLISGYSLNIFYIWPTTYVFWYVLSVSENKHNRYVQE